MCRNLTWCRIPCRRSEAGFLSLCLLFFIAISPPAVLAEDEPDVTEPKLLSVFPVAGQRGTTVEAEVRGNLLEGARALWFDAAGLKGRLLSVEEVKEQIKRKANPFEKEPKKPLPVYRALIQLEIAPTAHLGVHSLRLVCARGVSDAIRFRVVEAPVVVETTDPHSAASQAQAVSLPALVSAKLGTAGELDYYSFRARRGNELRFEVFTKVFEELGFKNRLEEDFEPRLALYRPGGSWLNPDRPTRVLLEEERSSDLMPIEARGTYRVAQDGQYLLEVSSLFGKGSPDSSYLLRIAAGGERPAWEDESAQLKGEWQGRSFRRRLQDNWMKILQSRTVDAANGSKAESEAGSSTQATGARPGEEEAPSQVVRLSTRPASVAEQELDDPAAEAPEVSVPSVLAGRIDRPGDVDRFKFRVKAGQKLAFEIETPQVRPPHFNPRLGVVDSENRELFSNIHRRLSLYNSEAYPHVFLKRLEPKAIHTFEREGEYVLEIRDITSRYGDHRYAYRVLLRSQIPHLGAVSVKEGDRINLIRGKSKKLTVTTAHEEGFSGDVSFTLTGLPEGVQAFPGAETRDKQAPTEVTENPETVAPNEQKATIVLLADPDAPITSMPAVVRLYARPIVNGEPGSSLLVREILLMVIERVPPAREEKL